MAFMSTQIILSLVLPLMGWFLAYAVVMVCMKSRLVHVLLHENIF